MLHYFRLNDPYRLAGLLILLIILFAPFLFDVAPMTVPELKSGIVGEKIGNGFTLYTEIIDYTEPLTGWWYALTDFVFGKSVLGKRICALVILFLETTILGLILINKKAFPESSFIPPLVFGILCAFSFDTLALSGDLMALFFMLLALNSLFGEIESRELNYEFVLKTGFFIGIASLFNFSFIVYGIATLFIQVLFTRASGRKILLIITGLCIPHLLLMAIYQINGGGLPLWKFFYLPNLAFSKISYASTPRLILLLIIPVAYFVASLIVLNRESRFTKYQSQLTQAMFFWTAFSVLQVYYSQDFRPQSFLSVMVGFSFFIAHFFAIVMRRRFAEMSFWIFLGGIASVAYLSRYESIGKGTYTNLIKTPPANTITGKKIVLLEDNLAGYYGNTMATPFLNWPLSEEIFSEPEYYENIITVYNGFSSDWPDVIVDPKNLMYPFLEKVPDLRRKYRRTPQGYSRVEG